MARESREATMSSFLILVNYQTDYEIGFFISDINFLSFNLNYDRIITVLQLFQLVIYILSTTL